MLKKWYKALRRIFLGETIVGQTLAEIKPMSRPLTNTPYYTYTPRESFKEYSIRKQIGGRGRYVRLFFNIHFAPGTESKLLITSTAPSAQYWEESYRKGVKLFYLHYTKQHPGSLTVTLDDLFWLAVDTTEELVKFAAADACCKALNFEISGLSMNNVTGVISFPEE